MNYYVDANAKENGDGSLERPFLKIQQAADIALAGDNVFVAPGLYREAVNPKNKGTKGKPISYISSKKNQAHISGAELLKNWQHLEGNVYFTSVPNSFFGDFNPYTELVSGDWFIAYMKANLGDIFLNEKSLYQVQSLEEVKNPVKSKASWDADFSIYVWYTEQDTKNDSTVFYANFQGKNPNEENVEFSVRKNCFYPEEEGINYITLSGFKISQAASQWAPPTAYQEGIVGPHWSKGWIIEDCEIYEAKCSGISLGKYRQKANDNKWLKWKYKDGTQTERDCICQAQSEGWSKEKIGSHIIRRCNIHDCGQTGIVGHLGGVFSVIEDNHIHHINNKQNLAGAEIGGIKMHAAIDVIFRRNHIHHCTRGLWLDWQAQGTRVSQNFFHDNTLPFDYLMCDQAMGGCGEDIFIEVSHGPTLLDNNILLSDRSVKLATQGVALVHNLIGGSLCAVGRGTNNGAKNSARYTPYHFAHRTEVAGFMTILHGDCKFFNNVFFQKELRPFLKKIQNRTKNNDWDDNCVEAGTFPYDNYKSLEEWKKLFEGYCGMGSPASDRYYTSLPVWAKGNVYFNGARPMKKENDAFVDNKNKIYFDWQCDSQGKISFKTNLNDFIKEIKCPLLKTDDIPMAFESEEKYENPDSSPITFDQDYFGKKRDGIVKPGPFA